MGRNLRNNGELRQLYGLKRYGNCREAPAEVPGFGGHCTMYGLQRRMGYSTAGNGAHASTRAATAPGARARMQAQAAGWARQSVQSGLSNTM